jgi:hypothetical protein
MVVHDPGIELVAEILKVEPAVLLSALVSVIIGVGLTV